MIQPQPPKRESMRILGNNLRRYRDILGKTRKEIAIDIGVEPSTYGLYEQGLREPSLGKLRALATVFHTTMDDLAGYHLDDFSKYKKQFLDLDSEFNLRQDGDKIILEYQFPPSATDNTPAIATISFDSAIDFCHFMQSQLDKFWSDHHDLLQAQLIQVFQASYIAQLIAPLPDDVLHLAISLTQQVADGKITTDDMRTTMLDYFATKSKKSRSADNQPNGNVNP